MALKNINIMEQHVEKIVLAVAAAGAVFMAYLALQPVTLPDHPEVSAKKVEAAIGDEIQRMDDKRRQLENAPPPQPVLPDFVRSYRDIAGGQPLERTLVDSRPPEFGPHNLQPQIIVVGPEELVKSVVPDPPAPELVHAEALQLQVSTNPPQLDANGQPIPLPPGLQLSTVTKNVVAIDGYIPVGKMVLPMVKETDPKKRLTPDVQKGVVYRVRVFRRELLPNGGYSKPEPVGPAKGFTLPTDLLTTTMADGDLPARLADIDTQFQAIQLPPYYVDAQGQPVQPPILTRPIPQNIQNETTQLHNEIQAAQAGAVPGGFTAVPQPIATGVPATAPGVVLFPTTINDIKTLEVQPFNFWDDSVQPDHTYKYSLQIQLVNPGFGWKWGLANPALKLEPVLPVDNKGLVDVPGIIVVHSDMAFFIQGTDLSGHIGGQIYKQKDGRWYAGSFSVDRGMDISGQINVGPGSKLDVDTKFALVDYQEGSGNVHVILKAPAGNLVTRDTKEDWNSTQQMELFDKVKKAAAAAATATAPTDPVTGLPLTPAVTPTTPTTPMTNPPRTPTPVPATRGIGPPVRPS